VPSVALITFAAAGHVYRAPPITENAVAVVVSTSQSAVEKLMWFRCLFWSVTAGLAAVFSLCLKPRSDRARSMLTHVDARAGIGDAALNVIAPRCGSCVHDSPGVWFLVMGPDTVSATLRHDRTAVPVGFVMEPLVAVTLPFTPTRLIPCTVTVALLELN